MATSIFLAKLIGPFVLVARAWRCLLNAAALPRASPTSSCRQPGADLPVRRHHAAGRPRDRAGASTSGPPTGACSSPSSAGSPSISGADPPRWRRSASPPSARRHRHQPVRLRASAPRSTSWSGACSAIFGYLHVNNRPQRELTTMNKPITAPELDHAQGHHRPARRLAQDLLASPRPRRTCACRSARSCCRRAPSEPPLPVYDTTGPYTDNDAVIDVENGLEAHPHRMGEGARRRRGIRRPPDQAGRQRQRHRQAPRPQLPEHAEAAGARSTASRSRNTNSPRPASSPRR